MGILTAMANRQGPLRLNVHGRRTALSRVAAATRSEFGLTVVDGGTAARPRSDHFAFVRKAVPSLYLHIGPAIVQSRPASAVEREGR